MAKSVQSQNLSASKGLTQVELRSVLKYDPETGVFIWLDYPLPSGKARRKTGSTCIGSIAGSINKLGYQEIRYNNKLYLGHRLAWLYVHGAWPKAEIDHIDGHPSNNRISNLREANRVQQNGNRRRQRNNASGFKGVVRCRNRFAAYIKVAGETRYLGMFDTPEEAHASYMEEAKIAFGEFARAF